jgi:hypothetical protein
VMASKPMDPVYLRSDLIDRVCRGELTPEAAEEEAARLGVGKIEERPDPATFDPMREVFWSMPMCVAWIAYRSTDAVRDMWDAYREQCWDWHFRRSRLGPDGPIAERYLLEARERATMLTLFLSEAYDHMFEERPGALISVTESESSLIIALKTDCFRAIGIEASNGERREILPVEWIDLRPFRDTRKDYYAAIGGSLRFDDIQIRSGSVVTLWPLPKSYAHTLPPVLRPEGSGFMPLYCAALWIATEGGIRDFVANDVTIWKRAFADLLERIGASEVRVNGVRDGAREAIPGVVFAGCAVDHPHCDDGASLVWGDAYYLQSHPYVDDERWRKGYDDSFRRGDGARWIRIMVSKPDVAHFWPFNLKPIARGAAGRPTSMHLVKAEFEKRCAEGQVEKSLSEQARALSKWLTETHKGYPPCGKKAIEAGIRDAYRSAKIT